MNVETLLSLRNLAFDPYEVLGLPKEAGDSDVREAYERLTERYRDDGKSAKRVEEAYRCLRDAKSRSLFKYLSPTPIESLDEVRDLFRPGLKYLGPGIWMRAVRESAEEGKKEKAHERY